MKERDTSMKFIFHTLQGKKIKYAVGILLYGAEALLTTILSGELYRIVILMSEASGVDILLKRFAVFLAELLAVEVAAAVGYILFYDAVSETDYTLRKQLTHKLIRLPIPEWHQESKGYWINLVNRDVDQMSEGKKNLLATILRMGICVIGGLIIVVQMSIEMTIFSMIAGAIYFGGAYLFKAKVKAVEKEQQKKIIEGTEVVTSVFDGFCEVKYYEMEKYFSDKHERVMDEYQTVGKKFITLSTGQTCLQNFGYSFSYVGLLVVALWLTSKGKLTLANAMYLWPIAMEVCYGIQKIGFSLVQMQQYTTVASRVETKMSVVDETGGNETEPSKDSKEAISLEHVSFSYPQSTDRALSDINLRVKYGEKVAIVGFSGSGKSTLLKLLLKFYDANDGEVKAGGKPVQSYTLKALRVQYAYLPQSPYLFEGTIEDNLRLVAPDASDQEMRQALEKAHLERLTGHTDDILACQVGAEGSLVSGGERQRIGLARCYLKNADILLLDEMTSALDHTLEDELVKELFQQKDKAVIYITHRLETAKHADRVITMECGKIMQEGTHSELMDQEGLYKNLWNSNKRAADQT